MVWDRYGKLKPPLSATHQRLYDRVITAKKKHAKTGSKADFRVYMDLHGQLARSITAARARMDQAMRETENHRSLANQVDQARERWHETENKDDLERWLVLKKELSYVLMEEIYDEDGNLI